MTRLDMMKSCVASKDWSMLLVHIRVAATVTIQKALVSYKTKEQRLAYYDKKIAQCNADMYKK